MRREKGQLNVVKANSKLTKFKIPHISDSDDLILHSKLLLANAVEISSIIENERHNLQNQIISDGEDCPESVFVHQAIELLNDREKSLVVNSEQRNSNRISESSEWSEFSDISDDLKSPVPSLDVIKDYDTALVIDEESNLTLQDIDIAATCDSSKYYYFYQADDGQHLYLHNVNMRMLQAMYGSIEYSPPIITGKVLQKQNCSMTEDLRKRLKFLQHLPVSCQFEVAEIELDKSLISTEIWKRFKGTYYIIQL